MCEWVTGNAVFVHAFVQKIRNYKTPEIETSKPTLVWRCCPYSFHL